MRFFSYHQPRRIRIIIRKHSFELRANSPANQARQYGILEWLGADRVVVNRQEYDQLINQLVADKLLAINDQSQAILTEEARKF